MKEEVRKLFGFEEETKDCCCKCFTLLDNTCTKKNLANKCYNESGLESRSYAFSRNCYKETDTSLELSSGAFTPECLCDKYNSPSEEEVHCESSKSFQISDDDILDGKKPLASSIDEATEKGQGTSSIFDKSYAPSSNVDTDCQVTAVDFDIFPADADKSDSNELITDSGNDCKTCSVNFTEESQQINPNKDLVKFFLLIDKIKTKFKKLFDSKYELKLLGDSSGKVKSGYCHVSGCSYVNKKVLLVPIDQLVSSDYLDAEGKAKVINTFQLAGECSHLSCTGCFHHIKRYVAFITGNLVVQGSGYVCQGSTGNTVVPEGITDRHDLIKQNFLNLLKYFDNVHLEFTEKFNNSLPSPEKNVYGVCFVSGCPLGNLPSWLSPFAPLLTKKYLSKVNIRSVRYKFQLDQCNGQCCENCIYNIKFYIAFLTENLIIQEKEAMPQEYLGTVTTPKVRQTMESHAQLVRPVTFQERMLNSSMRKLTSAGNTGDIKEGCVPSAGNTGDIKASCVTSGTQNRTSVKQKAKSIMPKAESIMQSTESTTHQQILPKSMIQQQPISSVILTARPQLRQNPIQSNGPQVQLIPVQPQLLPLHCYVPMKLVRIPMHPPINFEHIRPLISSGMKFNNQVKSRSATVLKISPLNNINVTGASSCTVINSSESQETVEQAANSQFQNSVGETAACAVNVRLIFFLSMYIGDDSLHATFYINTYINVPQAKDCKKASVTISCS